MLYQLFALLCVSAAAASEVCFDREATSIDIMDDASGMSQIAPLMACDLHTLKDLADSGGACINRVWTRFAVTQPCINVLEWLYDIGAPFDPNVYTWALMTGHTSAAWLVRHGVPEGEANIAEYCVKTPAMQANVLRLLTEEPVATLDLLPTVKSCFDATIRAGPE